VKGVSKGENEDQKDRSKTTRGEVAWGPLALVLDWHADGSWSAWSASGVPAGLELQVEGKSPGSAMMNQRSVVTIGINARAELRPQLR
jgi:hypothetical protein